MTIAADLVAEVRSLVNAGLREEIDFTAAPISATPTSGIISFTVSLGTSKALAYGGRITIDLEEFYVTSIAGTTVSAARAMSGTVAAAHASGAMIRINPVLSDFNILRAINQDILDMSSPMNGLYKDPLPYIQLTAGVQTLNGYDLTGIPTDFLGVYEVRHSILGITQNWPMIHGWRLGRNLDTAVFPSGQAIFLDTYLQPGVEVRVFYRANFSQLVNLTDDVASVAGLWASAMDIPVLGAGYRLSTTREVKRARIETAPARPAQDVPPQAMTAASANWKALRQSRIAAEAARLAQKYPLHMRGN